VASCCPFPGPAGDALDRAARSVTKNARRDDWHLRAPNAAGGPPSFGAQWSTCAGPLRKVMTACRCVRLRTRAPAALLVLQYPTHAPIHPLVKRDARCPCLCAHGRPGCGADRRCAAQVPVPKYKHTYLFVNITFNYSSYLFF
jgi:hypothetical protein